MLNPVQLEPKEKGGSGGLWGKIIGAGMGLGAAVAAPFTAGTSMAALPAAMAAAGVAAPIIGSKIDPKKIVGGKSVGTLQSAAKEDPQVQIRQTMNLMEDIRKSPDLDDRKKQDVFAMGVPILDALKRRTG